jgi:hypothetical protein
VLLPTTDEDVERMKKKKNGEFLKVLKHNFGSIKGNIFGAYQLKSACNALF